MDYKEYEEKYAKLLVNKCLVNNGKKPLLIVFESAEILSFAKLCSKVAKECGYKEVNIFNKRPQEIHEYLLNTSLENIEINSLLDRSLMEEMAKKEANILILDTFQENCFANVSNDKLKKYREIVDSQLDTYYDFTSNFKCPWNVACYPTVNWAKKVYPNLKEKEAFDLLFLNIMKMCLCDKQSPEKEWEIVQKEHQERAERLNDLQIRKLHYSNNSGTNLDVYLPSNHIWLGADDKDYYGNSFICNMPAYELFTSPIYSETKGTVLSSMPIYYNGKIINKFGLEFKKGQVTNILTSNDEDYKSLKELINTDDNSKFLGECAIVESTTPVGQTNTLYYNPSYDENYSTHLALGTAYPDSIKNGLEMSKEELIANGLNVSKTHVDFMIGTKDLEITADTKKGKMLIFSDGRFRNI